MTQKLDNVENLDRVPFNGFTMLDSAVTTNMLAIVAEATDYTKKSLDGRLAFIEKLVGAKSFDSALRIQSEYAKKFDSRGDARGHRDTLTRLALQRANIMHLVDLKREGYSPRRTEMRIGRLTARARTISSLSKNTAPAA